MWFKKMIEEELQRKSLTKKITADREFAKTKVEVVGYFPDGVIDVTIPKGIFTDMRR